MINEKYICPLCSNEMHWTGYVSQDINKEYCSMLYKYRCGNLNCKYEKKYKQLDYAGIKEFNAERMLY